ncbi:MAG: Flp pilus assembly complex ATPase component TadA [Thermoguttaceae bacterium]|nr:Flp pilus assembly complex ATPase component TadA [Thermoguttaceae bacterium]
MTHTLFQTARRAFAAALLPIILLLLVGVLTESAGAASKKEEKEPQKEDYYSTDNWYGNFFKSFKIWSKDLRYTSESAKTVGELGKDLKTDGWRKEPGHFFSAAKLVLLMLVFWIWVATTTWVNNDAQRLVDLHRVEWNTAQVAPFPIAFLLILFIPVFWIGYPVLVLSWFIPLCTYIVHRNSGVLDADKVMTPDHLVFLLKRLFGMDVSKPKPMAYMTGAPIEITSWGKHVSDEAKQGRTIAARNQQPGFNHFKEMVYQAIRYNAMMIRVTNSPSQAGISFFIDGVWIPMNNILDPARKRPVSAQDTGAIVHAMKVLVGADPDEHARRQGGEFLMKYDRKKKMEALLVTQGKAGAEEALIQFQLLSLPFNTLEELGMTPRRQEMFRKILAADKGFCLLGAAPGQGLRTFTNVAFNSTDRFTRDFVTVEDVQRSYMAIENLTKVTYDSAKKETPMTVLPDVFFKEPKVLLLRDIVNLDTLKLCCEEVGHDRLIVSTFRGVDAADTIMRVLQTGVPRKLFADSLFAVVTQRLIRRLCPHCKEEIPAPPELIRRLGLNPQTVKTVYRRRVHAAPEPGQKDHYEPCPHCLEIGYWGRAGVYDVILVNDEIRQIITTNPSADAIRKAALKSGQRGYFTDGAELVASGVTSFDEFRRFMQGGGK